MLPLLFQLITVVNPGYVPIWQGREPIQWCVSAEMEPFRAEVTWAFHAWAAQTGLFTRETRDCSAPRTVAYRLGDTHGYLGWTSYPAPLAQEPEAGDVILDARRDWRSAPLDGYLLPLLLHETGHALGMAEDPDRAAVMCPLVAPGKLRPLGREIRTIRFLYQGERP